MKKTSSAFLTLAIATMFSLTGCSDELPLSSPTPTEPQKPEVGVFPNSKGFMSAAVSRAGTTFETNWEECKEHLLNNGDNVNLPWSSRGASFLFDPSLAYDIKKEDGWVMVYHTLDGGNVPDKGVNYMVFYNQRTGRLKMFYYSTVNNNAQNGGTWQFNFIGKQRVLNCAADIAIPMNHDGYGIWQGLNPISIGDNGFTSGWSCIQLELAYQGETLPKNTQLQIGAYNFDRKKFSGDISLEGFAKGMIISEATNNTNNQLVNSMATLIGNEAGKWFEKNIYPKTGSSNGQHQAAPTSISASGIISSLVSKGLSKMLTSFTGRLGSSTSYQTMNIELKGSVSGRVTGEIISSSNSNISPCTFPIDKEHMGTDLGAWNLKSSPTVYIHPVGVFHRTVYNDEVYYTFRSSGKTECEVVFNPDLKKHIKSYSVRVEPVRYFGGAPKDITPNFDTGTLGTILHGEPIIGTSSLIRQSDLVGEVPGGGSVYDDHYRSNCSFVGIKWFYGIDSSGEAPTFVYLPEVHSLIRGGALKYKNAEHPVRVVVNMVTEFEGKRDTTIMSRTYIPRLEWDPELCTRYDCKKDAEYLNQNINNYWLRSDKVLKTMVEENEKDRGHYSDVPVLAHDPITKEHLTESTVK